MRTQEVKTNRLVVETITNAAGGTPTIAGSTSTEQELLDGAVAGTVVAGKAVAVDSNKDVGDFRNVDVVNLDAGDSGTAGTVEVFPATAAKGKLKIAAVNNDGDTITTISNAAMGQASVVSIPDPGAATANFLLTSAANDQSLVSATAVEINVLAGVTPGTNAASKAVVAGTDGKAGALTFDGAITMEVEPLTTSGNGAVVATVTAVEKGDGVLHKTILTCTATAFTFGDEAAQGQYGGTKIYDFPAGLINVMGAVIDGDVTLTTPAIDTWAGHIGLGVEAPTDHQDASNKTGLVMPKVVIPAATAKVAASNAVSVATALTESGARWLDGTGTAKDLFLNILINDDALHDNTITGTFTGTVTILWANIGDIV